MTISIYPPPEEFHSENRDLAEKLNLIASYYKLERDLYRTKTYDNAAISISKYPFHILSGKQAQEDIYGIGESIATDIDEYLTTGQIKRLVALEEKHKDERDIMNYFMSFYGIGPVAAHKHFIHGYRTLSDLWYNADLNQAQRVGILWRYHIDKRIPRAEMDLINDTIKSLLPGIKYDIAGSYRRGEPDSGDVDILIENKIMEGFLVNMGNIMQLLEPILPANLAVGSTKYMGILRLSDDYYGHRVDIRLVQAPYYPFALLYFTGSQRFNILIRDRAKDLGYKLNEYGLYQDEVRIDAKFDDEQDIFDFLGLVYLTPEERTSDIETLYLK